MIRILHPWYLLLLLAIPVVWRQAKRVRVLGRGRKKLALVLRAFVLLLFILALAEIELLGRGESLTVFFVIDRSSSIPPEEQEFSLAYAQDRLLEIPEKDRAGIIFFGKDAAIQENPGENVKLFEYQTIINPEGSDVEGAIGLAMAAFPEGMQKRIVLLTDGNQTRGNAELAAQRVKANGIDLRVLPLRYTYTQDAMVEDVILPSHIREKEPFSTKIIVNAQEAGPARLRLYQNDVVVADQEVELQPGKNAYTIPRSLEQGGYYKFEASIEAEKDNRPSNNRSQSFTIVKGTPKVLLLDSETQEAAYLAAALLQEGIEAILQPPEALPDNLNEFQYYDSILLSNVPASDISKSQQDMLELAVRDLGIGLVMIGGPDSFGAGGYLGTPVEKALPVTMDIKQRRVIPSGALALIMHSCEIPQGNYWAQEISLAALDVLSRNDYFGFLRYSNMEQESWLVPMKKAGDKRDIRQVILSAKGRDIGDMPSFDATMQMAYEALKKLDANMKHLVILSDGDPARPTEQFIKDIHKDGISISTVCIAPHNQTDVDVMKYMAELGGGNAYHVQNNKELPKIFTKEASIIRRNLINEEQFTPVLSRPSEVIQGFGEGFPMLDGYVVTGPKPEAETVLITHKEDPLLAHWRYGLGKTVAFTSDAKRRWAGKWLGWEGYAKFWSQIVRWTLRSNQQENFEVQTKLDGDQVHVVVDAMTENGEFLNELSFTAGTVDPGVKSSPFKMRQTQPGRYEGTFPAREPGSYLVSMAYEDADGEEQGNLTTGISVPFSPEHTTTRQNDLLLKRLAEIFGKSLLTADDNVFSHDSEATGEVEPLWPILIGLAIFLFFLDIAVRRVFFDMPQLHRFYEKVWAWLTYPFTRQPIPIGPATQELGHLMQAKARATQTIDAQDEQKESFLHRLDEVKQEDIEELEKSITRDRETPIWHEAKKEEPPPKFADEEEDSYTSALFKAKSRVTDRLKDQRK
ncbi:MAG: VWA domain-containing protein [Candidatus Omnitrophota bacterium]|jgi:uncharacterized membrane protein|nr:MAG: VWA domain-containing protein [Candidatus Omnitrophota bacterium]